MPNAPVYVIGDVHGQIETLTRLLQSAGLVGDDLAWTGGKATLWFVGDYVDRGPDGIGVIDLLMRLEAEAKSAGGGVQALLGNHDVMFLAADRFRNQRPPGADVSLLDIWERNGGKYADLDRLSKRHIAWLRRLPVQARVQGHLLQHADSTFYAECGRGVADVNRTVSRVLQGGDISAWATLIVKFVRR
ncbi:MAG: serine/threonine protein phosphatase, partial [Armatimonadota bacterium]|nr:serine/threonine protein phosphatase [Armatimonadota bacterium]